MDSLAVALVLVAVLAWDAHRRWVAFRRSQLIETTRLDALEAAQAKVAADFKTHADLTGKAVTNLAHEMRTELAPVKTDLSIYKQGLQNQANGRRIVR